LITASFLTTSPKDNFPSLRFTLIGNQSLVLIMAAAQSSDLGTAHFSHLRMRPKANPSMQSSHSSQGGPLRPGPVG
jgi:hypothetical protein